MTAIPDFTTVDFSIPESGNRTGGDVWQTPEGIAVSCKRDGLTNTN